MSRYQGRMRVCLLEPMVLMIFAATVSGVSTGGNCALFEPSNNPVAILPGRTSRTLTKGLSKNSDWVLLENPIRAALEEEYIEA